MIVSPLQWPHSASSEANKARYEGSDSASLKTAESSELARFDAPLLLFPFDKKQNQHLTIGDIAIRLPYCWPS